MSLNIVDQTTGELTQAAGSVVTAVYSDAPVGAIVPFGGSAIHNRYDNNSVFGCIRKNL